MSVPLSSNEPLVGVKAIDEADKSGLAGARVTDDADYLTGFYGESDIIKRGGFSRFIVAKDFGYAAELNASALGAGLLRGVFLWRRCGRGV